MCVEVSLASISTFYRLRLGLSFVEWSLYPVEQVHNVQDGSRISHLSSLSKVRKRVNVQ